MRHIVRPLDRYVFSEFWKIFSVTALGFPILLVVIDLADHAHDYLNRHISARCGQTFKDTFNFWRKDFPASDPPPFVMLETWNDHEEGTAIEGGIPTCGSSPQERSDLPLQSPAPAEQGKS